jgi:ubiquinone biosynthesis UbiH/UbiF/VisC/COQ6 family hydroxylase
MTNKVATRRFSTANPKSAAYDDSFSSSSSSDTDVLIVGGGAVGLAVAYQLARRLPAGCLRIGLVEAGPGPEPRGANRSDDDLGTPNPRSYALSPSSLEIVGLLGDGESSADIDRDTTMKGRMGWYDSMQVWEASQPSALVLTSRDAGLDCLGAVVEDSALVESLWDRTVNRAGTVANVWTRTAVTDVQGLSPASNARVTLENEVDGSVSTHQTRLLIAADGANSSLRRMAGIGQSAIHEYGQTALTFTVEMDRSHILGRCYQRFLASGPLALLPTHSPKHAIVVWSASPQLVEQWKDHPDLVPYLNEQLQQGPGSLDPLFWPASSSGVPAPIRNILYGIDKLLETIPVAASMAVLESQPFVAPPHLRRVASRQFTFPLATRHSDHYVLPRLALVGDAAHTVHPFAGQGLNLGLQDVDSLVEAIVKAVEAGMDPAAFLGEYEASRRAQVALSLQGLHAVQQLYGMQNAPAKYLKALGMSAIQSAPPLRRAMVEAACFGVAVGRREAATKVSHHHRADTRVKRRTRK